MQISTALESRSYLGLNTVVKRSHPQDGVDLTYIKQTGESNGDAADQYTGLDRFRHVVDQRWIITASGVATDRFQCGYDRDGNVLYSDNLVNSSFSELYHANGASHRKNRSFLVLCSLCFLLFDWNRPLRSARPE